MTENEIVVSDLRLGSLQVDNSSAIIIQATAIATELAKLVNDRKLYNNIQGKKYVRVEGWNTLGAMLGVLPREFETHRLEDGGFESTVELIRASDGRVIGQGSAIVGMDEPTWSRRPEYARRSMAITRATGKAFRLGFSWIMALAGYEGTPAEEMPDVVEGHVVELPQRAETNPAVVSNGRPYSPEIIKDKIDGLASTEYKNANLSDKQRNLLRYGLELCFVGAETADMEDMRHHVLKYLTGTVSTNGVAAPYGKAIMDKWLKITKDESTGDYNIDPMAAKEAVQIYRQVLVNEGQAEMKLDN